MKLEIIPSSRISFNITRFWSIVQSANVADDKSSSAVFMKSYCVHEYKLTSSNAVISNVVGKTGCSLWPFGSSKLTNERINKQTK